MGLTTCSQGQFSDPNSKKKNQNKLYWSGPNDVSGVFSQKYFFRTKTPPLVDLNPKIIFFSETAINKFAALFEWFYMILCFGKKKKFFWQVSPGSKIFCIFLDDLSSPNAKFECFSGFWFLIFWPTVGLLRSVERPKLKKLFFK